MLAAAGGRRQRQCGLRRPNRNRGLRGSFIASSCRYCGVLRQAAATVADAATTVESEADDGEEKEEPPTPYPKNKLYPLRLSRLLKLTLDDNAEEEEIIEAMELVQDLHEFERQWVQWPVSVEDARTSKYKRGLFMFLRGMVRYIRGHNANVRDAAVELMYALCVRGTNMTRVPPVLAVEVGAFRALCTVGQSGASSDTLQVIWTIIINSPVEMVPTMIKAGALDVALHFLQSEVSSPMDLMSALDVIFALTKRAPAKVAQAGAYELVKGIDNDVLVPKRNKIMNLLRPLVQSEEDMAPKTNIRPGGLKY